MTKTIQFNITKPMWGWVTQTPSHNRNIRNLKTKDETKIDVPRRVSREGTVFVYKSRRQQEYQRRVTENTLRIKQISWRQHRCVVFTKVH